jgi:hypothetical protein
MSKKRKAGNQMENKIYIVTHKRFDLPALKNYQVLGVGSQQLDFSDMVYDHDGDEISQKNPNYCELTALYWLYKNVHNIQNIGLCHYRRYFSISFFHQSDAAILSVEQADAYLKKYDILLPYPRGWFDTTVEEWFLKTDGFKKDTDELRNVISLLFPEYLEEYDTIMHGYEASYLNMFYMSKEKMDAYCAWLFSILFELEKRTDLSGYTPLQARIFGFLSERLFNVWILHNQLKIKYLPVYERENPVSKKEQLKEILKHTCLNHTALKPFCRMQWGCMEKKGK